MKKIFAVDDEGGIIEFLKFSIENMGYQFSSADTALSAIKKIEEEKPDLILVDIMLSDMDGISLCRRLKSNPKTREIPIIMLTSLTDSVTVQEAFFHGAAAYIPKPFDHDLIKSKIEEILSPKTTS